jgi:ADP-heptose:LPS heptosyltransferase/GT2 family glycosyltransferase
MPSFFEAYEAVRGSGLFDGEFYRAMYPDVAELNADPLTHYLETGAAEGRLPSPGFDVDFYLEQCVAHGERPDNPLLHFIFTGVARGFRTCREAAAPEVPLVPNPIRIDAQQSAADIRMFVDTPRIVDGAAVAPIRGSLDLNGWACARAGVATVNVSIDGVPFATARTGIKRVDVQRSFCDWPDALYSGFALLIPHRALPRGTRTVTVTVVDRSGTVSSTTFQLKVVDSLEGIGPWALRRKLPAAEAAFHMAIIARMNWQPEFLLFVYLSGEMDAGDRLRVTLQTLRDQAYSRWRAIVVPTNPGLLRQGFRDVIAAFPDISTRITVIAEPDSRRFAGFARNEASSPVSPKHALEGSCWIGVLQAGDRLSCDALLRLALETGVDRDADLVYSDERCWNVIERRMDVFFKPGWSPDLLLAKNYFGRLWLASERVWEQAGATLGCGLKHGEYDLALRCAEQARKVRHTPYVLCQRGPDHLDTESSERNALVRALGRRSIRGAVVAGVVAGTFRIRRTLNSSPLVSIIIATCGARGLIRACIESIRRLTDYSNYEIVCIQNIPDEYAEQRAWLSRNVDVFLAASEPFNWSEFNNVAADSARGEIFIFLNDDTEIVDSGWLLCLVEQAMRPEVGAVGPMLLYPDGSIQHAGLHLSGMGGSALHTFRYGTDDHVGWFGLALTQRNVIAVTGACLCTRRTTFEQLRGFDPRHTVVNNDVDYCLRVWEQRLLTVYTPHTRLIHHEMASRRDLGEHYDAEVFRERWSGLFGEGDPLFNSNLSRNTEHPFPDNEAVEAVFCGRPLIGRETIRRILVMKIDHIGDCITALPAIRRLKDCFPDAQLNVLSAPWSREIWALEPSVEDVIEFEMFYRRSEDGQRLLSDEDVAALAKRLAPMRFDLAIDLRKSPDTRALLLCSGAPWLAGFDHVGQYPWLDITLEWEGNRGLQRKRRHVADDLIALVDAVAAACEEDAKPVDPAVLEEGPIAGLPMALHGKPVVCMHPGAGAPLRQWPAEHFATLIDVLLDGHDVHVALIGSADEQPFVAGIRARATRESEVFMLAGTMPLAELARFLAGCVLFVGNNSGPQHLAAELGIPTVGVHSGVVDPVEWGPRGPLAVALRRNMSCSPCYLQKVEDCPRELECLTGLTPMRVARTCAMFLVPFRKGDRRSR